MKDPAESVRQFCLIQLEILKEREIRLRKDIAHCNMQKEFLAQILKDIAELNIDPNENKIEDWLDIIGRRKK